MRARRGAAEPLPGGRATADPALAMLRGGALPTLAAGGALLIAVAASGVRAVAGVAVGAVVVCLAMAAGPVVMRASRRWSPPAVMAISLLTYGVVVIILGVVYLALERVAWLSPKHLGVALIACCAVWTAGQLQAVRRLRVLTFGDVDQAVAAASDVADGGPSAPGQEGSTGPELPSAH